MHRRYLNYWVSPIDLKLGEHLKTADGTITTADGESIPKVPRRLDGVRYCALPGGGMVYRTGTGSSYGFEFTDLHGTPFLMLDHTAQAPAWRQFTPFVLQSLFHGECSSAPSS